MTKLTLADITDLRAYERERTEFLREVIRLKKRRRVPLGPIVTLVFENRDTVRFQIQEMARVEKIINDDAIETELRIYNPLIPEPGQLCATLFIELTEDAELREWLPKLVGIERSVVLRLPSGEEVSAVLDEGHAETLTREEVTASVHYLRWELSPSQIDDFASGKVTLASVHPGYDAEVAFEDETHAELVGDLRNGG